MEAKVKLMRFIDIKTFDGAFFKKIFNKEDKTLCNTFVEPEKSIF